MIDKSVQYNELASKAYPYRTITACYMICLASLTIVLIFSLLASIYKYNNEKNCIDTKLCIILLYFDLMCSSITLSTSLFSIFNFNKYVSTQALCNLNGILNFVPFSTSIELMGIISLERCLLIVLKKSYSYKVYYGMLLAFLLINGVINSVQTTLNKGFNILPNAIYCLFDPSTTGGLVGSIISGVCCVISYTLIVVCYVAICVYRRNESRKTRLGLGLNPLIVKQEVTQQ